MAVDPQSRNRILEGIMELNRQGSTIIYTSHYMEEVEHDMYKDCDQWIMEDALRQGPKEQLYRYDKNRGKDNNRGCCSG